ncbi:GIY-YIG nuclease family protein [Sunxiuqinia sp. A32]|uniref:GIY-YIG nuclease family protein n=1 Tax=Sunxiuqinia sp. A32 TaxID=3461496 RepID=UPI0040456BB8
MPHEHLTPVMYTTYVLHSRKHNKIYVGFSSDVENRLNSHNDSRNSGWTKRYQPWELIYQENFESKGDAIKRERELKSSRGRAFIKEKLLKI